MSSLSAKACICSGAGPRRSFAQRQRAPWAREVPEVLSAAGGGAGCRIAAVWEAGPAPQLPRLISPLLRRTIRSCSSAAILMCEDSSYPPARLERLGCREAGDEAAVAGSGGTQEAPSSASHLHSQALSQGSPPFPRSAQPRPVLPKLALALLEFQLPAGERHPLPHSYSHPATPRLPSTTPRPTTPHWPPCCYLARSSPLPPQGLCTCCPFCLKTPYSLSHLLRERPSLPVISAQSLERLHFSS